jgi:GNAT superfamily N-acetyltransferase
MHKALGGDFLAAPRRKRVAGDVQVGADGRFGEFQITSREEWHEYGDPVEEDDWNMLAVIARHGSDYAGSADFVIRDGKLEAANLEVEPQYHRRGLATAMYV